MKEISIVTLLCSMGLAAQAQLIDDFSSGTLIPYTQTIVLAQNGDGPLAFSAASGALSVSRVASNNSAQQDLLLRNDVSLSVGYILRIDTAVALSSAYSDLGIAVSATANPPGAVWTSGTADVRQNYVAVYVKGQTDAIGRAGFNGTSNAGGSSGTAGVPGLANLLGLFISRPAADTFNVGYTTASGDTVLFSYTGMNTSIGSAIGFYSDLRSSTSFGSLDNLRLEAIPEPGSLALLALGGIGWILRRRQA